MNLFILSDLHIRGVEDPIYTSLLTVIRDRATQGDTVVLAGDIFDLYIGNKAVFHHQYQAFFDALLSASQRGVELHYIEGNHDFLLKGAFQHIPHMRVYDSNFGIERDGKKFYIAHGDEVDRKDYGYRLLRAFFRSPIMALAVFLSPGKWLNQFGQFLSRKSRGGKPFLPMDWPLDRREYLRKLYRSFAADRLLEGYDFVVMGHCHDLDEMSFKIGPRVGQYMNVGFPRIHGSYLVWSSGDPKIQREKLPD